MKEQGSDSKGLIGLQTPISGSLNGTQRMDNDKQVPEQIAGADENPSISDNMWQLKEAIEANDIYKFRGLGADNNPILDRDENLMILYACVHPALFCDEAKFYTILQRFNCFKTYNQEWYALFKQPGVYRILQQRGLYELDYLVLKAAIHRQIYFMEEKVYEKATITQAIIQLLMENGRRK